MPIQQGEGIGGDAFAEGMVLEFEVFEHRGVSRV